MPGWVTAVAPLGPGYRAVADRVAAFASGDDRIVALFLTGSVGRGVADAASDLDVLVFVRDDCADAFREGAQELAAAAVGPTIICRRMPFGVTTVTPAWERVDLLIAAESSAAGVRRADVVPVFDRAGVAERLSAEGPSHVRDPRAVAFTCEEFLRVLGLLPVVLYREEYLVGVDGASLLRGHLRDLLVQEANRPALGVKRLNERLGDEGRSTLAALPGVVATRESVIGGHLAAAAVFLPRAKALCKELTVPWPAELERATRSHLADRAGVIVAG